MSGTWQLTWRRTEDTAHGHAHGLPYLKRGCYRIDYHTASASPEQTCEKMKSAEEKLKNVASSAKEHINIAKAKLEEKAEKAAARTPEEREIAHQQRKAKEAEAKMELHRAKAQHAAEKFTAKHSTMAGHAHEPATRHNTTQPIIGGHGHQPIGTVDPATGTTVPTYPLGGHPPHSGHTHKHM